MYSFLNENIQEEIDNNFDFDYETDNEEMDELDFDYYYEIDEEDLLNDNDMEYVVKNTMCMLDECKICGTEFCYICEKNNTIEKEELPF